MALRSQEEISLATLFARTLRNVIALTASEDRRVWPTADEIVERVDDVRLPPLHRRSTRD